MSAAVSSTPPQNPAAPSLPDLAAVLGLVRYLIGFACRWADRLREGSLPEHEYRARTSRFATTDVTQILLRMFRGLRRAVALEAILAARAQRGRELKVAPIRFDLPRLPGAEPRLRPPRPPLPLDPSDEEIAADVMRRPVGAVLVDICRDLGIVGGELGPEMHGVLSRAVMFYGGNLTRLLRLDEHAHRARQHIAILRSGAPLPPELQPYPVPFAQFAEQHAAATGPP